MAVNMIAGKFQQGFTYMGLLVLMVISGIGMSAAGITWQHRMQQQKEKELLFIGRQYRNAIESYYRSSPNGISTYPKSLQDLVLDKRFPTPKHHLRQLYPDPFSIKKGIAEIKINDFIVGVHSHSALSPLKKVNFGLLEKHFEDAKTYQDWQFTAQSALVTQTSHALK